MKTLKYIKLFEDRLESLRELVRFGLTDDATEGLLKALDYMIAGSVGSLDLEGSDVVSLPDGLRVGGSLILRRCTGLKSLPAGLVVEGSLYLEDCTGLTSLPDGLKVGGSLFVTGCTRLRRLPDGLRVKHSIFLNGSSVQALPADLEVGGSVFGLGR